ncbi:LOW QUALITY PROTEIN: putative cis-zeatin O-glucosyltransferase [Curcuma longa]|uniref:LOW QUALITY PROTEIN: putative cis-zeatin O-glucosyltransferase n=1 Tax=Curcuma longa TaxID=136217 RepID=UPI003D9DC37B
METVACQGQVQVDGTVAVLMVPLPAQSHLAQLLHLSLFLCSRPGLTVHYASTTTHIRQATSRLHPAWSSFANAISFHELPIPAFCSPHPDPSGTKFPAHLQPLFDAFEHLRAPVGALLRSLSASSRRVVVIHDRLASFAAEEAAALPNAESYVFHCLPALFQIHFARPSAAHELSRDHGLTLPSSEGIITEEFEAFVQRQWTPSRIAHAAGMLLNTCRALEGEFLDMIAREPNYCGKKLFAIGPLSPLPYVAGAGAVGERLVSSHECLDWLDKQPPASVVYVSFGTTTAMSSEEVKALAQGLLLSQQRFLWVLRDADRADIFAAEGSDDSQQMEMAAEWEEKVGERGMVVRGWAPQLDILTHQATGAFLSHCGWNSCAESLCLGVPMVAWPMHSDQPTNAALVVDYHGVGVAVRAGSEAVGSEAIAAAIRRVMVGEESEGVRRRARELGEAVRAAVADGGASRAELDAFVALITR